MKSLLVGHDFSPKSARALLRAFRLAKNHESTLCVVNAVSEAAPLPNCDEIHQRLLTEVQTMAEELDSATIAVNILVRPGFAPDVILHEAEACNADLILLGGHGEPRFRDVIFGTTGTHLVRHGNRPVLLVQDGDKEYSTVMIAVADPATARALVGTAFDIAPRAEAYAVHAFSPTLAQTMRGAEGIGQEEKKVEVRIAEEVAQAAADRGEPNLRVIVETGEALSVLTRTYETLNPDLLAMGTHSNSSYLGSRAVDTIFWCPHDLLIVPERKMMRTDVATVRLASADRQ